MPRRPKGALVLHNQLGVSGSLWLLADTKGPALSRPLLIWKLTFTNKAGKARF